MKKPLPRTARPDPYIENGEFAYIYMNGRFRKVKSDHHTGGGSFQYNFCDNNEVSCSGWAHEYLLSPEDLKWFKNVLSRYGNRYHFDVVPNVGKDDDLAYLVCWFESADLNIRNRALQDEASERKVGEYCLDPDRFLAAIKAVEL